MGALLRAQGLRRWLVFLLAWVVLAGAGVVDLLAGVVASGLAACLSLHLLPPSHSRLNLAALPEFCGRFAARALLAGVDAARRALSSPLRLQPGILPVSCAVPEGAGRDLFRTLSSLQPGTLPLPGGVGHMRVHCLDTREPVAASLDADARAFLTVTDRHG
ncbi:Na+/H+ antiporter subunit E [Xanthobacter autotrophicus DSM 431]|uniref:Na+/H+ antiporter subunit E n=1 Tax=Xanthobacter nonsaccharivorans TaxID=3119912 RepID=UPI00372B7D92